MSGRPPRVRPKIWDEGLPAERSGLVIRNSNAFIFVAWHDVAGLADQLIDDLENHEATE